MLPKRFFEYVLAGIIFLSLFVFLILIFDYYLNLVERLGIVLFTIIFIVVVIILILFTVVLYLRAHPEIEKSEELYKRAVELRRESETERRSFRNIGVLKEKIKSVQSKGLSEEKIMKKMTKEGWSERAIDMILDDVHVPSKKIEKLKNHILNQKMKGRTNEEIKEALLGMGWDEDVVDVELGYVA